LRSSLRSRFALLWLISALLLWASGPGFRSKAQFHEHYQKHGAEFGSVSQEEYLRRAQELRDTPVGGPILESVRRDGVFTRFDKTKGYFGAYNPDRTIRTFFIPNDGERYFHRQAKR
jgi:pyocin large subunit-like protein